MKCKNCTKNFHYCVSCGYIIHAMLDFCSDDCMEYYYTHQPASLEELASIVYSYEDSTPEVVRKLLLQKKEQVGTVLVDKLLEGTILE